VTLPLLRSLRTFLSFRRSVKLDAPHHGRVEGLALLLLFAPCLKAQQQNTKPAVFRGIKVSAAPDALPPAFSTHRFWDKTNIGLFLGVAAVRTLDFTSTQHFRERGVNEALLTNSIVDNKPLFAGIEVAGTAASIAVSYLLHRTGHHKLERWVSIVHIGVGTFGDARNYTLSHPAVQGAIR
jgi:hypothetical protein